MENRPRGAPAREGEKAPRPNLKEAFRRFLGLTPKKRSPYQGPSQSSNPPVSVISELPDNQQIPSHQRTPSYPQGPNYLVTHGQYRTDMPTAPPGITTQHPQYPPERSGQQAPMIPPEVIPGTEIIIAVMGVTGKSYFIREVTGNPNVRVNRNLYSCTSKVQPYSFEYVGAKITLVDTPGFNDIERSDAEVLQEITDWTSATYKKDQLLNGIIYLHPITHTRMGGSAMRNLRTFQSLCGQEVLENVLLTTTQWSNVDLEEGQAREDNLRDEGLWGGLIRKGATLQKFHGTRDSGFELIHKLMWNTKKPLDIQDQIVEQRMTLLETDAGKSVNEELIALEKKFKERMESLEKRFRDAIKAKDDEMKAMGDEMRALMDEKTTAQKELKKVEAGMKLLTELHAAEVKKREAREREEEAKRSDRAVIAVATRDIEITAHIAGVFTSYKTRGRLILDIDKHEEFESDTIEVTINYQLNFLSGIRVYTKTFREVFDAGIGDTNYIVLDGVHYRCRSGIPIRVGSQEFVIFSKG
ncbi:hypothetical protein B9Z19DRAFT_474156 [Tuber borchii]|uniref:G domain-containing protein n=1 Tax=Tuber borchii TaxID=42251 RepID=A0A2T6ZFB5_TUBBO|nr:hypothetical protein B9Z19DRAFT_474156 [Tuber borchii]